MQKNLVMQLAGSVEAFLIKWSEGMDRAGYLKYTTAKREDCIQSFWGFLGPVIHDIRIAEIPPSFGHLLQNPEGWADALVATARRHRNRGVTAEMFLGCFKTLVQALEELVLEMDAPAAEKLEVIVILRCYGDACETLLISSWTGMGQSEAIDKLADTNRSLTLEKNKYENILAATSDAVLVTDSTGKIMEANDAARRYLGDEDLPGRYFWDILNLEGRDIVEVTRYYAASETHEINLFDETTVFNLRIVPLKSVSLASSGFMVLLTNVSCLVEQRESLEKKVSERTLALANTEKQFASLFQAAGEGILLIDADFKVVEANQRSGHVFGLEPETLSGRFCKTLCDPVSPLSLEQVIRNLDEGEIWEGEMSGLRADGNIFPMAVTINRVDTNLCTLFQVLIKDITNQKRLEENLRREKAQLEEMNITLRNIMKTIDHERQGLQNIVAQKVEDLLLPALDKAQNASSDQVRKGYLDIIRDQLGKLAAGAGAEPGKRLLKLTPTEIKICRFIQAGSTTKDIAEAMYLSVETVQSHRKSIRKKLGLHGRQVNLSSYLNVA